MNDADIRDLPIKPKPYKKAIGKSLFIQVMPNGSKYFRYKYSLHGKQQVYAIGVYPEVSLLEAITKRDKIKRDLIQGKDPSQVKREERILGNKIKNSKKLLRDYKRDQIEKNVSEIKLSLSVLRQDNFYRNKDIKKVCENMEAIISFYDIPEPGVLISKKSNNIDWLNE